MRTVGGLGYLLIIGVVALATEQMAVTLYDAGSSYRRSGSLAWPTVARTAPAVPEVACAKGAASHGCLVNAPGEASHNAANAWSLDRLTELWAVIRQL
jgi:hypothetical protein